MGFLSFLERGYIVPNLRTPILRESGMPTDTSGMKWLKQQLLTQKQKDGMQFFIALSLGRQTCPLSF